MPSDPFGDRTATWQVPTHSGFEADAKVVEAVMIDLIVRRIRVP